MNYIVFDLEATCWEHPPAGYLSEIIEIGAFRINAFGEVRGRFNRFVKPALHPVLSPFCRNLTSITQAEINRADAFPKVIEEFIQWARIEEEDYILCSWGGFDKRQLAADCRLHRLDADWTEHHINLKEQYRQMKRMRHAPGLKRAVENEDILFTGIHHRGISDAENLVKLFLKYLDRWSF